MKITEIISFLEFIADPSLQEHYDNAGLITGNPDWGCKGIICSLDVTEEVIEEAVLKKCNLIVAHHPIIFTGLKKINGKNYVERTVIAAIKNDIAIYAIHTNLDNVIGGVNGRVADKLGLKDVSILSPKDNILKKLFTFVPVDKVEEVRKNIFIAGGGHIGNYSGCSFTVEGTGTFTAGAGANPYTGRVGEEHREKEMKIEVIFPAFLEHEIVTAMKRAHPYEEVAYDIIALSNTHQGVGSGIIGRLHDPMEETSFLAWVQSVFGLSFIRHTAFTGRRIEKIAFCGGTGSFLISKALATGADAFITADLKYHEFFDSNNRILLVDIGHFESEQFTINLLQEVLEQKFPTFAILKTAVKTNPVHYFAGH